MRYQSPAWLELELVLAVKKHLVQVGDPALELAPRCLVRHLVQPKELGRQNCSLAVQFVHQTEASGVMKPVLVVVLSQDLEPWLLVARLVLVILEQACTFLADVNVLCLHHVCIWDMTKGLFGRPLMSSMEQ